MNILSSFTHPHVIPNLYEFLSYAEHKIRYSFVSEVFSPLVMLNIMLKNTGNQTVDGLH